MNNVQLLLTNSIRDSEIVKKKNWPDKDVMREFTLDMVLNNEFIDNIPPEQRHDVAVSIYNELKGIIVKRNVSNNEFSIHKAVQNIEGILTKIERGPP